MKLADIAAVLTAAGAIIYVLGLVGFTIPIRRIYATNLPTAWYAVSLIPNTVVAGQGARIWLQWPAVITTMFLLLTLLGRWAPLLTSEWVIAIVSLVSGALIAWKVMEQTGSGCLIFLVIIPVAYVGGTIMQWGADSLNNLERAWSIEALLLIFGGSFVFALPLATADRVPLPRVEITTSESLSKLPQPLVGQLVAHRDGTWHLFLDNQRELFSIPQDKVLFVRTVPAGKSLRTAEHVPVLPNAGSSDAKNRQSDRP